MGQHLPRVRVGTFRQIDGVGGSNKYVLRDWEINRECNMEEEKGRGWRG